MNPEGVPNAGLPEKQTTAAGTDGVMGDRCMMSPVQIAVLRPRYPFSPATTGLFTAVIAIETEGTVTNLKRMK